LGEKLPLGGIRVIELGHIVAAPFAGMIMRDLGAEVIKVERPGGEVARNLPDQGPSIYYALNRGKKSVTLNLKTGEGRKIYLELARRADIIIENMGPGIVDRLGVGFDAVSKVNPNIIYVSIKGFGESEYSDRPALDVVAQALSGIMSVTGIPGGEPIRVGTSVADMIAGLYGVLQAIIALYNDVARPVLIESPLYDTLVSLMAYWIVYVQVIGKEPEPIGSGHHVWAPYRAFPTRNGWIFIGVTSEKHWEAFCKAFGFDDLLLDERFKTNEDRVRNKVVLEKIISDRLKEMDRDEVERRLIEARIPNAPIRKVRELVTDEYLFKRRVLSKGSDYHGNPIYYVLAPLFLNEIRSPPPGRPPLPGEHNVEILSTLLGYSEEKIGELARSGVL